MPKFKAIIGIAALASIGIGLWCIYPPLAPIVLGLLIWHDIRTS